MDWSTTALLPSLQPVSPVPLAAGSLQWQSPLLHFQYPAFGLQKSQRTAVLLTVPGVGFGVTFPGPDVTGPGCAAGIMIILL